ncbi:related to beta transducin-like protein [Phialocephala subalpina]|uniref:Related to beta transducin-like protein n=1 Tax=Phialocephala subalpina TaxID=576137 RepID=A0A1L7X1D6_9HELO|nr:related to beta transducin-like protein [Phialocephala subalpina]
MRLINVKTLKLEKFLGNKLPPYAILSHTWKDDEELTLCDIEEGRTDKPGIGSDKLQRSCKQAEKDNLSYIWIDTCCIDKTDSVELGEAINSMFRWYNKATICYAYLLDVPSDDNPRDLNSEFRKSRWFKRGWTLQELLAPQRLQFYSSDWRFLGTKGGMCNVVEEITGISRQFLLRIQQLHKASVAQRMSWAAQRETTREEDIAYCLLGIFGVSLPMIYGERREHAFFRLQEQIMKTTRDDSILAWGLSLTDPIPSYATKVTPGIGLATSPSDFANCKHITSREQSSSPMDSLDISGGSLRIYLSLITTSAGETIGLLKCGPEHEPQKAVGIPLSNAESTSSDEYIRPRGSYSVLLPIVAPNTSPKLIYIKNDSQIEMSVDTNQRYWLYNDGFAEINLDLIDVSPRSCWDKERSLIVPTIESHSSTTCRTLARFRHIEEGSRDFVIVLEIEQQKPCAEPQCYVMICSRDTSLADLAENFRYMSRKASRRRSASNGILSMHVTCESIAREPIIIIRPHVASDLQEVTSDATFELQKLDLRLEFAKIMEEEGQTEVENRDLEQKVKEESTRLEQTRRELEVVEDELRNLTEKRRILVECSENRAEEIVRLNSRQTEIKKRQEDISTKQSYIQRRWDGIPHVDYDGDDCKSEAMDCKTLLRWAAEYGHEGTMQLLLQKGADVEAKDKRDQTPLYLASMNGHYKVAQLLLDQGADVKAATTNGWTPLHVASTKVHCEVIQLLLDQGADVKAATTDGWMPLHVASANGYREVTQLLLDQGADVKAVATDGWTPLHVASTNGHCEVTQLLLDQGADVNAAAINEWTPLYIASMKGHGEVAQLLLDRGADVKAIATDGATPLHIASTNGYSEVAQLLLDQGADVKATTNDGWTPLHVASTNGNREVIQLLLDQGANVKAATINGVTPLYVASMKGHGEVAQLLLDRGADVIATNSSRRTPLY